MALAGAPGITLSTDMALFASDRERRLWWLALAVVVAIWSTLGLAGTLVATLRDRDLLDAAFVTAFAVVIAAIAVGALRKRPRGREIWVGLAIAAVYGMVIVRMGIPVAERTHLFEYGLVAVLVHRALDERRRAGRRVPVPAVLAVAITASAGWIDEGIQALLPHRVYDLRDVGFNALAAVMAVGARVALVSVRRRR